MQLLTFAHKNEAAAFFHFHQFVLEKDGSDLYFDGQHYLLITGEGLWDSLIKISLTLQYLEKKSILISHILNLGVAGSLRNDLKKFEVYQIRTTYAAFSSANPEFHSYTTDPLIPEDDIKILDCLSCHQRILNKQEKENLMPYAHIVDRELWAQAKFAEAQKIPWNSLKIISDELEEENICELIQEQAHEFSYKLYLAWQKIKKVAKDTKAQIDNSMTVLLHTLQQQNIFLTFSQKHQVCDLTQRILAQENISCEKLMTEIPFSIWTSKRVKDNTQDLIHWLKLRLTPQFAPLATPVSQWLKVWHNSKIHLQMNTTEDYEALEIKFKSYNHKDWKIILEHLNNIPRQELENIITNNSNL
jgi:nucleoside phosphorylase